MDSPNTLPEDLGGIHLLLVEDVDINARIGEKIISRWNVKVAIAANGQQAVEKCKTHSFDIILMDISMPVMDGIEATKAIRLFNRTVPIIALSGSEAGDILAEIRAAGMNDCVEKPFEPDTLYGVIRKWLKK